MLIFTTDQVQSRDRFAYWHEVACSTIVDHGSFPKDPAAFFAHLNGAQVDDIGLLELQNAPMTVQRSRDHVARAEHDDFLLCLQRDGRISFQGSRDLVLDAGQATILDPMQQYVGQFDTSTMMVVRVPRRELEARLGPAQGLVLARFAANNADLITAATLLHSLIDAPQDRGARMDAVLRDAILDLLAVGLGQSAGAEVKVARPKDRARFALRSVIGRHIADPHLTRETVARLAGVSIRYANEVLSEEETSVSRLILTMRLRKCAESLGDATQVHRSIQEIAFAWGFSDQTHFGRRFREFYGLSPREFRRTQLGLAARN